MWPFRRRSKPKPVEVEQPYEGDPERWSLGSTMQYGWRDLDRKQARDEALEALGHGSQTRAAPTIEDPSG